MKYAFDNANLIDGTQDMRVQPGLCVLTDGETITDIVPAGTAPAGYTRIDLHGRYLLPGLINMHVHLAGNGKIQKKQRDLETLVRRILANPVSRAVAYRMVCSFARTELLGGVTTIRTVGGLDTFDTRLRDEIRAGRRIGPRVLAANEAISVPGGHMAGSVAIAARTVDEALAQVDAVHAQGADLVKLMITGSVMDATERGMPGEVKMPAEMVRAVCERAHALGYTVAAHTESTEGVRIALQNGVDSIEHGAKPDDEILRLFEERGAFLCATFSPALPYARFDRAVTHLTEDEQFKAYKTVAERMGGRRVIIRTLDIGADKQADYFHLDKEENPAMGLRAIRICLTRPEVFRTQLRALYRASAYGKIAIMFPMITSVWEVQEIKRICRNIRAELAEEGVPMADKVELGIMIETPAAVMMSVELAREVDFFSVGTNDLTQYTLAVDRQGVGLDRFFDAHHPAVLRMIRMAAENAHKAGIWIGICGELGADAELTETFLSMGIDELSVSPSAVLPLRSAIRSIDTTTLAPLEL